MLGQSFPSLMQEWAFFLACVFIKCLKRTLAPSVLVDGTTSPPPGVFESVTLPPFSVVASWRRNESDGDKREKTHTSIEMPLSPNSPSMPQGSSGRGWRPHLQLRPSFPIIGLLPIIRAHLLHTKRAPPPSLLLPSFLPSAALRCFNRARINRGGCPACQT